MRVDLLDGDSEISDGKDVFPAHRSLIQTARVRYGVPYTPQQSVLPIRESQGKAVRPATGKVA